MSLAESGSNATNLDGDEGVAFDPLDDGCLPKHFLRWHISAII